MTRQEVDFEIFKQMSTVDTGTALLVSAIASVIKPGNWPTAGSLLCIAVSLGLSLVGILHIQRCVQNDDQPGSGSTVLMGCLFALFALGVVIFGVSVSLDFMRD